MIKRLQCLILVLLLTGCESVDADYRVKFVQDGDSMIVCCERNNSFTIRLKDIDAPEREQPFAKKSREFMQELVMNKPIRLIGDKRDQYGRMLVDLVVDGQSVNELMVSEGMAWRWRYSKSKKLKELEESAREARKGLWALPESQRVEPWEWRKQQKRKD
ncbi:thermonuclease family protein [Kangiella sp.]|uniref:thermonuclease family protein n=1 Tax=Kangiella sp. TaxID=1920245 RepID=UPI001996A3F1|nr:thermonuclease family protein [Kangiella sp.]MBD3653155.1 thermonuclease family protein [Kangiella sp.]